MTRNRRLLLLATTAAGLWWLRGQLPAADEGVVGAASASDRGAPLQRGAALPPDGVLCTVPRELPARALLAVRAKADPFSLPPPPRARAVVQAAPPPAPPPPPPAVAPRPALVLPYRYLGGLSEPGATPRVFLALGPEVIDARAGDALEGGYVLERIAPRELVFRHPQRNETLRMAIEGEPQ